MVQVGQEQPTEVVLKIFAIFTGKKPVLASLSSKVMGLKACNIIEKRLQRRCSCEYCEIFKNTYFEDICERLLLEGAFSKNQLQPGIISERHHKMFDRNVNTKYLRALNIPWTMNMTGFRIMNMSGLVSIQSVCCWFEQLLG